MQTQERFRPYLCGINTTTPVEAISVGCFLAKTSGTIRLVRRNTAQTVVIDDFPVTSGQYYQIPFLLGEHGAVFTTAGGASGTLGIG